MPGDKEYRVNVLDENGQVVGRVRYNNNLDWWDGNNWTCGAVGKHKGLTKLKDGRYVLIHEPNGRERRIMQKSSPRKKRCRKFYKAGIPIF